MPRPKGSVNKKTPAQRVIENLEPEEEQPKFIEAKPGSRKAGEERGGESRPSMTAPEWNDWCLEQLRDDEKDPQGNPTVDGLRRLVEDLLGPVVSSLPHVDGTATEANGLRATVTHTVAIRWNNSPNDVRVFGAAADVYSGNTDDEYARFPAATADTRAESRALRKALRLRRVVTAEEITMKPVTESGIDKLIVDSQIKGINKLCKDLDINAVAFINSGKNEYTHFTHVPYTTAQAMLEGLNRYLRESDKIPARIKGYDANWRNSTKGE